MPNARNDEHRPPNADELLRPFSVRREQFGLWLLVAARRIGNQATKDSMEGDGIDMSSVRIEYLDEIDSGTR